ncbi:MAG: WD40 repeat domain-containing serine/threonine protein kinase, partial [Planctomycetota bacterium]
VTTLSYGRDAGLSWIAQELVRNSWTVKDAIDSMSAEARNPRGYYKEVARLIAQVADGLQAAHEAGVIHRDVKPQNILIDENDTPKVTDFGLARVTGDSVHSQTGDFAGTWAYMSPEQVTAKRAGLDHRTDIFSLGVVLYEMLALRRPFVGDTTQQVAQEILFSEPLDVTRVRSQCPRELATIAGMAMRKVPSSRYDSMRALSEDLRRFLARRPIQARPPGIATRVMMWSRRRPGAASSLAIGVAALIAVLFLTVNLAVSLSERDRALEAERGALREQRASSYQRAIAAAKAAVESGTYGSARKLLMDTESNRRGIEFDLLNRALEGPFLKIPVHRGIARDLEATPDGRWIATRGVAGEIALWDHKAKRLVTMLWNQNPPYVYQSMAFNRRDNSIFAIGGTQVVEFDLNDPREPTGRFELGFEPRSIAAHPNQAVVALAGPERMVLYTPATEELRDLPVPRGGHMNVVGMTFTPDGKHLIGGDYHGAKSDGNNVYCWDVQTRMLVGEYETGFGGFLRADASCERVVMHGYGWPALVLSVPELAFVGTGPNGGPGVAVIPETSTAIVGGDFYAGFVDLNSGAQKKVAVYHGSRRFYDIDVLDSGLTVAATYEGEVAVSESLNRAQTRRMS